MCHHASATKDAYVSNVRILKFSVHVRRWIEANDLRPQQNCSIGAAVSPRPQRFYWLMTFPPVHGHAPRGLATVAAHYAA